MPACAPPRQACDLSGGPGGGGALDPFATVKCEREKCITRAIARSADPCWDEFFVFEVKSPAFAVLRVKVHGSTWLGGPGRGRGREVFRAGGALSWRDALWRGVRCVPHRAPHPPLSNSACHA
jgi:hypothetical protein